MDKEQDIWSEEEKKILHYETFITEVLKKRDRSDKDEKKSKWQKFLESNGGTALITVIIGGLLGQYISCSVQQSLKDRDFQQSWMRARADQTLAAYNEHLKQEQELTKNTFELISTSLTSARDLILLTSPDWAPGSHVGIEKDRKDIREEFNKVSTRWENEQDKIALQIGYYHGGQSEAVTQWRIVQASVSKYIECSLDWYSKHPKPTDIKDACHNEKEDVRKQLDEFAFALENSRNQIAEHLYSPEKLKLELDKSTRKEEVK